MKLDFGGLEVDLCTIRLLSILLHVPMFLLMCLVFGEQNCDYRARFKANVNIADATSRGSDFGGSTKAKIMSSENDLTTGVFKDCHGLRCHFGGPTVNIHQFSLKNH